MSALLWLLALVLVVVGLAGILLPGLPGTALIFVGLLLAAWADGFTRVGAGALVLIGAVGAATFLVDVLAASVGTRRAGASPRAMLGAALGTAAGLFFGLPGIIIGPFAGAVVGELTTHRDVVRAGKVGVAAWLGFVVGMGVKVGLAFLMIALFAAAFLL